VSGGATTLVTAALFGLDKFVGLGAADAGGDLELLVETIANLMGGRSVGRQPGLRIGIQPGYGVCRSASGWW